MSAHVRFALLLSLALCISSMFALASAGCASDGAGSGGLTSDAGPDVSILTAEVGSFGADHGRAADAAAARDGSAPDGPGHPGSPADPDAYVCRPCERETTWAEGCRVFECIAGCGWVVENLPKGTACDDGNPCTEEDRCVDGVCRGAAFTSENPCAVERCVDGLLSNQPTDGAACDDGDPCTVDDACDAERCVGEPLCKPLAPCDETDPVVRDGVCQCLPRPKANHCLIETAPERWECAAEGELVPSGCWRCTADDLATDPLNGTFEAQERCDDGDLCTFGDTCRTAEQRCVGTPTTTFAPCLPCEEPACDGESATVSCVPAAGHCVEDGVCYRDGDPLRGPDGLPYPCLVCDGDAGAFGEATAAFSCDDDDACTLSDHCTAGGGCRGTPFACPPINGGCARVACDGAGGCDYTPDPAKPMCLIDGVCHAAGATEPGNACRICDPGKSRTGWTDAAAGTSCEDEDCCVVNDVCDGAGRCIPGDAPLSCDDGQSCTADTCDRSRCGISEPCIHTPFPDGAACENEACDTSGQCQAGRCVPGCPQPTVCDDGDACTVDDVRVEGECRGVPVGSPLPPRVCHDAVCDPETGAWHHVPLAVGAACDDGDACSVDDACVDRGGELVCVGAPRICEGSGAACLRSVCDPATGDCRSEPEPDGQPCDDGLACTDADVCVTLDAGGVACIGDPVACPATADPCAEAVCDEAAGGCVAAPVSENASCDDGDACTEDDRCVWDGAAGLTCRGTAVTCPAPTASCRESVCLPDDGGCVEQPAPPTTTCNDEDAFTADDRCDGAGACVGLSADWAIAFSGGERVRVPAPSGWGQDEDLTLAGWISSSPWESPDARQTVAAWGDETGQQVALLLTDQDTIGHCTGVAGKLLVGVRDAAGREQIWSYADPFVVTPDEPVFVSVAYAADLARLPEHERPAATTACVPGTPCVSGLRVTVGRFHSWDTIPCREELPLTPADLTASPADAALSLGADGGPTIEATFGGAVHELQLWSVALPLGYPDFASPDNTWCALLEPPEPRGARRPPLLSFLRVVNDGRPAILDDAGGARVEYDLPAVETTAPRVVPFRRPALGPCPYAG